MTNNLDKVRNLKKIDKVYVVVLIEKPNKIPIIISSRD